MFQLTPEGPVKSKTDCKVFNVFVCDVPKVFYRTTVNSKYLLSENKLTAWCHYGVPFQSFGWRVLRSVSVANFYSS